MKTKSINFSVILLLTGVAMFTQCSSPTLEEHVVYTGELPEEIDFNFHIRPILSNNCYTCHGPDPSSRKAGLRLDNFEGATAKLETGHYAILPHKPHKSKILSRVSSTDPEVMMPPPEAKKTLSAREVALLEKWIEQGAEFKPHWAFIPPTISELPDSLTEAPIHGAVDYYLAKALEENGLMSAAKADKNKLIRRVAYLLTGLPPTPEAVQKFIADNSADSYEKIVDQYLASPQFGERWARHWMDLIRYGESMGHEGDYNISHPWEYRDYLIRAFNEDVPYDQFVKEHLAGDMLAEKRYHPQSAYEESALATAYYFLGEGKHSPVSVQQEEADRIDNMIDVTSKTFQALTVSCARCHDHKFDPIPTTDYYAMYGMIESSRFGPIPARRTKKQSQQLEQLKTLQSQIREALATEWLNEFKNISKNLSSNNNYAQFTSQKEDTTSVIKNNTDYKVIGDFRNGDWGSWTADGWAFGENPVKGVPVFDSTENVWTGIEGGYVSSRKYGTGIQGLLRSPNFLIEHDYIQVKARGGVGEVRIVAENFQVIQNPLHGGLEQVVDSSGWATYTMNMKLCKGQTAYVEFLPGTYQGTTHIYKLRPEDYIEVAYVVAYDGEAPEVPEMAIDDNLKPDSPEEVISEWKNESINLAQIQALQKWIKKIPNNTIPESVSTLLKKKSELTAELFDSTHVIGFSEGEALLSPVFVRGSITNKSEETVERKFLTAVDMTVEFPQEGSGRLAWAEAVVNPENPLTARVMVNRLWHHTFGRGIVGTVDNFGLQGKLPSHPALLDYLAVRFMDQGWSIKKMLKSLMMTEAFQRSTIAIDSNQNIDPENIFLHHFPVRRLEAEAVRDGILAVSGELDLEMYGAPVPVHLNQYMTGRGRPQESGPLDGAGRRSIYTSVRRNFINPMMLAFDMPIPFSTFGRRTVTNVPAQSLTLLNDPFVHEQAQKWANRLVGDMQGETFNKSVNKLYWTAFSRPASEGELQQAKIFFEQQANKSNKIFTEVKKDALMWKEYCHTLINLKEFIHLL